MADDTTLNPGVGGDVIATDDVAGVKYQRVKLDIGGDGAASPVVAANPLPVTGPITDTQLRATPVPVSGSVTVDLGANNDVTVTKVALTAVSPTAASVGVASAEAVAANANRKGLVLTNTTTNATISLGFGAAAVLASGVTLFPGGVFRMDEYTLTVGAVNAIASAATSNLAIQEYS